MEWIEVYGGETKSGIKRLTFRISLAYATFNKVYCTINKSVEKFIMHFISLSELKMHGQLRLFYFVVKLVCFDER